MSEALPRNFLGLPAADSDPATAAVRILPVPYEATVSYLGGTKHGPQGMIDASRAVELYDHELDDEPYVVGVATLPELHLTGAGPAQALRQLRTAYAKAAKPGGATLTIMLGGEHSISGPPIQEWADRLKRRKRRLSVLQLDAHGDLREQWEGTPWSHACVMRRVVDRVKLVQVGLRAIAIEERAVIRRKKVTTVFAEELEGSEAWMDRVLKALGEDVYITIDVDYFDPSLVPATGTPEPGGGTWYPALRMLERVFRERSVVAADVVELAPIPGLAAPDFLVAKLVYKLITYHRKYRRRARGRKK